MASSYPKLYIVVFEDNGCFYSRPFYKKAAAFSFIETLSDSVFYQLAEFRAVPGTGVY